MSKFNPRILVRIAAALQQPGENATGKVPLVRIFPIDGPRLVKAQCELRSKRLATTVVQSER